MSGGEGLLFVYLEPLCQVDGRGLSSSAGSDQLVHPSFPGEGTVGSWKELERLSGKKWSYHDFRVDLSLSPGGIAQFFSREPIFPGQKVRGLARKFILSNL